MVWGRVTIGGVDLREEVTAEGSSTSSDRGTLRIAGQESHPPSTHAEVIAAHHNIIGTKGLTVPVVFTDKADLTGFYRVTDATSTVVKHQDGAVQAATWGLTLEPVGGSQDVEIESRVPTVGRLTDHNVAPVFWHAPAVGCDSYYTGATVPAQAVDRVSADGIVTAFLGIPADVAPRWTAPVGSYLAGAARLLFDGIRRIGVDTPPLAVWEMHNGLVRVHAGPNGSLSVSCWDNADWRSERTWQLLVDGTPLTSQPELTVLRNDPEEAIVRLTYPGTPGRLTVDLGLRRGSRVVTGIVKRHAAAVLGVQLVTPDAGQAVTGGVRAAAADGDGNTWVVGSSKVVTQDTVGGGIASTAPVTTLDLFLGHTVATFDNGSVQSGDQYLDLLGQYLGSTGERVRVVRR